MTDEATPPETLAKALKTDKFAAATRAMGLTGWRVWLRNSGQR